METRQIIPKHSNINNKRKSKRPKSHNGSNFSLTFSPKLSRKMYLPERYVTTFTNTLNLYIPAGASTAAAGNYTDICVNTLSGQYNVSYPSTAAPGAAYAFHASTVQGDLIAQTPLGYVSFASMYTNYKVMRFKLSAMIQPTLSSDTTALVLFPIGNEEIPSSAAGSTNLKVMASQPNAVNKIAYAFSSSTVNTAVIEHNVWDIIGQRKEQYVDQSPTPISSLPNNTQIAFAGLFLQQLNGANNTGSIIVQLQLEQIVELSDLIQPLN